MDQNSDGVILAESTAGGGENLAAAAQKLTEVADDIRSSLKEMTRLLQSMTQEAGRLAPQPERGEAPGAGVGAAPGIQVNHWEDDPFSEAVPTTNPPLATPVATDLPTNGHALLQTEVVGGGPAPAIYAPDTDGFRFWAASEAIARGINFWATLLPNGTRWTTVAAPMQVTLVAGEDLNANYSRISGLRFYKKSVRGRTFFSGESPDVVCHELGHAILDAIRPELFDAANIETAAFHESFGDMSAILSGLQLPGLRQQVLDETQGQLNVNSRLSRPAEQLGWAIRQLSPTAVDPDSLRNAANRFFYQDPTELPPIAPSNQLSSEAHFFSRVFTGGFFDALARMLKVAGEPTSDTLLSVSAEMGQILVDGVLTASLSTDYFSQVAAAMIQADQARNNGKYRVALSSSFVERGILSPDAAASLSRAPTPQVTRVPDNRDDWLLAFGGQISDGYRRTAKDAPVLPTYAVNTSFGLTIRVHAPDEDQRFNLTPAMFAAPRPAHRSPKDHARSFVEDLIQLGRIDLETAKGLLPKELFPAGHRAAGQSTHRLEQTDDGQAVLKRVLFDCGLGRCRHCR